MKVTFRGKSVWQTGGCFYCGETATGEAVCGRAAVQCCQKDACQKRAAAEALSMAEADKKEKSR